MISKVMDSIIAERYKNGRQWKLNFPERLLEGILSQTKNDYIASKIKLIDNGKNYPDEESYQWMVDRMDFLGRRVLVLKAYREELGEQQYLDTKIEEIGKRIECINSNLEKINTEEKYLREMLSLYKTCKECQRFVWHIGKSIATQVFESWDKAVMNVINDPERKQKYRTRITQDMIDEIVNSPLSGVQLAKKMGISQDTVSRYRREYKK